MAFEIAPVPPGAVPGGVDPTREVPPVLERLAYRSRAVAPLSELELYRLARSAQRRNQSEALTGVMVYDHGWVYQKLEGPPAGLARVWDSIRRDPRHTDIELLVDAPAAQRLFAGWDLKLCVQRADAEGVQAATADRVPRLIERLVRGEQSANALPAAGLQSATSGRAAGIAASADTRVALAAILRSVIIPRLGGRAPEAQARVAPPSPHIATLSRLLLAANDSAAAAIVDAALALSGSFASLSDDVLEPAARLLGDLWQSDDCSEIDVTLGLVRLQTFVRRLGADAPRVTALRSPLVLVAPAPGELHMLGSALDAEFLWRAGWSPRIEFPASSAELDRIVAGSWFDALDLSLSTALCRDGRRAALADTIAHARLASLNPAIAIVVSGRAFREPLPASAVRADVGADASFGSAAQAEATILCALRLAVPLRCAVR